MQFTQLCAAITLKKKWNRVCEELPAARLAFERQAIVGADKVKEWTELAEKADMCRENDVEAMDIYDVHKSPRTSFHPS